MLREKDGTTRLRYVFLNVLGICVCCCLAPMSTKKGCNKSFWVWGITHTYSSFGSGPLGERIVGTTFGLSWNVFLVGVFVSILFCAMSCKLLFKLTVLQLCFCMFAIVGEDQKNEIPYLEKTIGFELYPWKGPMSTKTIGRHWAMNLHIKPKPLMNWLNGALS